VDRVLGVERCSSLESKGGARGIIWVRLVGLMLHRGQIEERFLSM